MVGSGISLYAGAALAVGLFEVFPPIVVAWFRVAAAGIILTVLFRPKLRAFTGKAGCAAAIYGVVTMAMNMAFYQAINEIPLGTAVAIEFMGPVAVAAWGSRNRRDFAALVLATAGVLTISGATWANNWQGIVWALAAGGLWAGYIVAGNRISYDPATSRASMAVGFVYAGGIGLPVAVALWPSGYGNVETLGLAMGLGLLSAAIPYSLDQVVLRMAGASYFALLQAILPLVAAVVGAVALGQWLSPAELAGTCLVVVAVALRRP
ncbi:EamA family transporter [Corynebacterium phocae]|nr:EamA family transporter [Corynebacterium phocae]